jgi:ring-1,2-phenylacetyl-CoA epoxidase subunit PaaB
MESLDPRINRLNLSEAPVYVPLEAMEEWQTYEVFHQKNRGDQHIHVGIVHAPNADLALLFAKEQFARRSKCVNLWVVKTADITASAYEDEDMFSPSVDKSYREAYGYRVRGLIDGLKTETGKQSKKVNITEQITENGKKIWIIQRIKS